MSASTDRALAKWLLDRAGPVVRYRTVTELLDEPGDADRGRLANELLAFPLVQRWLGLLEGRQGVGELHGSRPSAFENVMGKLCELGVRAGAAPLDKGTEPFRRWLAERVSQGAIQRGDFYARLVAGALARSGYLGDEAVSGAVRHTLERLARTAREGRCDIWLAPDECAGLPKACQGKPLIKPEFQFGGQTPLPLIHDLYGFTALARGRADHGARERIGAVVGYVLRPEFQKLPDGYGYFLDGRRRTCWAHGWGVHLPGSDGLDLEDRQAGYFVQRLELMAHFPRAVASEWFAASLRYLEEYRTGQGTYRFPSRLLREQTSGYYVTGAYMGLGENRRSRQGMEIESTFRILKIRRLSGAWNG